MTHVTATVDQPARLLTLTLRRTDNERNQLNAELLREFGAALEVAAGQHYRGVIVASGYPKVFSTGADIESDLAFLPPDQAVGFAHEGRAVFDLLTTMPCLTLAAISGFTLGGGLELALACDFRIAAASARLGLPEINLGILPGWGGTQRLPRLIGRQKALRMILSGDPVNAASALEMGLVDELVDSADDLPAAAARLLGRYSGKSANSVRLVKRAINEGLGLPLYDAMELESELFGEAWDTADRIEGMTALKERRKPNWPE